MTVNTFVSQDMGPNTQKIADRIWNDHVLEMNRKMTHTRGDGITVRPNNGSRTTEIELSPKVQAIDAMPFTVSNETKTIEIEAPNSIEETRVMPELLSRLHNDTGFVPAKIILSKPKQEKLEHSNRIDLLHLEA